VPVVASPSIMEEVPNVLASDNPFILLAPPLPASSHATPLPVEVRT